MKKTIALFLMLSFVLQQSAAFAADNAPTDFEHEYSVLCQLGVMNTAKLDENITRAEFVKYTVDFMLGESGCAELFGNSPFIDVSHGSEGSNEIFAAYKLGLVSGSNGFFNPADSITVAEATKILVCALGYEMQAKQSGGYPIGYLNTAAQLKITVGGYSSNDYVSGGICASLLYNSLNVNVLSVINNGGYMKAEERDGYTFLYAYKKLKKGRGIVDGTAYTAFDNANGLGQNKISVDSIVYNCSNAELYKSLGYMSEFYYSDSDEKSIAALVTYDDKNTVTSVAADDIIRVDGHEIYYDTGVKKESKISISGKTAVIYNNKVTAEFDESIFSPLIGDIVFVDNNRDSVADAVIIHSYKNYVVYSVNTTDGYVTDNYNGGRQLDLMPDGENCFVSIKNSLGSIVPLARINKWDVITALVSRDGKYVEATVSTESAEGQISSVSKSDRKITVADTEYTVSKDFSTELKLGDSGVFYFDAFGELCGFSAGGSLEKFACLIGAGVDGSLDNSLELKLLLPDGSIKYLSAAQSFTLNGKRKRGISDIPSELAVSPQAVQYGLNADGKISQLYTAGSYGAAENSRFYQMGNAVDCSYYRNGSFSGKYEIPSDALIFRIPQKDEDARDEDYEVVKKDDLKNFTTYTVYAYTTDPESVTPDIVILQRGETSTLQNSSPTLLVRFYTKSINKFGEEVYYLYLFGREGELVYECKSSDLIFGNNLKPGDMVKVSVSSRDVIEHLQVVFSNETRSYVDGNSFSLENDFYNSYRLVYGDIYARDESVIAIVKKDFDISTVTYDELECFPIYQNLMYVVDSQYRGSDKKLFVRKATFEDIRDYKHGGSPSRAVVLTSYAEFKYMVLYN